MKSKYFYVSLLFYNFLNDSLNSIKYFPRVFFDPFKFPPQYLSDIEYSTNLESPVSINLDFRSSF